MPEIADLKKLCAEPEANPLAIAKALDTATQYEWRDWEPAMLRSHIGLAADDSQAMDKVMACQVAKTNADVFADWHLFHHVATAFNHRRAHFEWLEPLSIPELAWACKVLRLLNVSQDFGPGVLRYIGTTCVVEGLIFFPWTGGKGLHLCEEPHVSWTRGLVDADLCSIGSEVRKRWANHELQDLEYEDAVDDSDPLHVQIQKIVAAQDYIRAQRSADPGK
jgi:hypothetical protein